GRAAAALDPRDLAPEEHVLVPARESLAPGGAPGRVAPESSVAADDRRARAEEGDRRCPGDASEVRHAGIGCDQERRMGEEMPELRQVEAARKRPVAAAGISLGHQGLFAAPRAPDGLQAPFAQLRGERRPAVWRPALERRAGAE